MAAKKEKKSEQGKAYRVLIGCNTSDDTRYEAGDDYFPGNHPEADTLALIEMGCLEECE